MQHNVTSWPYVERRNPIMASQAACGTCQNEAEISTLQSKAGAVEKRMDDISAKLDMILMQVTKVAVLEANHNNQSQDVTRAHAKIAELERKLEKSMEDLGRKYDAMSLEVTSFISYSKGRDKVIWALAVGVAALAGKILFHV